MRLLLAPLAFPLALTLLTTACESGGRSGKSDAKSAGDSTTNSGDATSGSDGSDGPGDGNDGTDGTDGGSDGTDGTGTDGTDGGADATDGGSACLDESYSETLPLQSVSIEAELAAYDSKDPHSFVLAVLGKRYPTGKHIVENGLKDENYDCIDNFLGNRGSGEEVVTQLSTVVHECGHLYDIALGGFSSAAYVIRPDLIFECPGGAYTGPNSTFARSLIKGDAFGPSRPPCNGGQGGCDFYADIYLDGDPDNAAFEGGDQGFDSVLEEATQYVNSLASGYAFVDYYSFSTSERDGILTFLWYVERYLHMARTQFPEDHAFLLGNDCWRDAILTVWGRAWLFLNATKGNQALGLEDAALEKLVNTPDLLAEIERVREADGCR